MMVGAFTAVASTAGIWNGMPHAPAALRPLPPAVLVHAGHSLEARCAGPVGIAVPSFVDGRVVVDAVLASSAVEASDLMRRGRLPAVSIVASGLAPNLVQSWRDVDRRILVAVDLVDTPADRNALIEHVVYVNGLTEGQRQTREAFDAHLAAAGPCQLDLSARFDEIGIAAFDVLAPVVAALRGELTERLGSRALIRT